MIKLAVALAFLAVDFYTYRYFATDPVIPPRKTFQEFPLTIGDWNCAERQQMTEKVEQNLGVTDYLICNYEHAGRPAAIAAVYVGYHHSQVREEGGGAGENSIHPPEHCLPGSGWDIIDTRREQIDFEGLPGDRPVSVNRLVIAKGEQRQLVYYWYQSRGRVIDAGWEKIIYVGWDRALRGRTDGSLVRITIPLGKKKMEKRGERIFAEFAPVFVAQLPDYVPE